MNGKQVLATAYRGALKIVGGRGFGRLYPFNVVNAWLTSRVLPLLKTESAVVHGHTLRLDSRDSLGLSIWGTWEPFETELITTIARPGDVVVDVGANIGYYTLLLARRVGEEGRVFAFEPAPDNFAILQENIARNGYRNVRAERMAVADHEGQAMLALSRENLGDHRLSGADKTREVVPVDVTTLDGYFLGTGVDISLVKMDVQGAELRVLRGMRERLTRPEPLSLILEFYPTGLEELGDDPGTLLDILRAHGFTIREIVEDTRELRAVDAAWYTRARFGTEGSTNLLCVKPAG